MIRLQAEDFDIGAELAMLTAGRTDIGAVVSFTGQVRDLHGDQPVLAMTLEHYPEMAKRALSRIEEEARRRWPLADCVIIHRFGRLLPGDNIVGVITASAHRDAAFKAASYIMDMLKTDAPFWKREEGPGGAHWVEARTSDAARAESWHVSERTESEKI